MKKKLSLDQLRVDSFEAGPATPRRGTVQAHELTVTGACTCWETCNDSCAASCFPTCWETCARDCTNFDTCNCA
ncbi:hypothetical protein [Longimicrobium sp.]|uniref:hypothetical protein n=1 Tax=Longimicrobium sp. TaxID=2029185 RepID=UPI002B556316|nr:hypothetical protein [Longimicrobium sp.]HSU12696.1 hypothetical protein [Longimicrobium sp.]